MNFNNNYENKQAKPHLVLNYKVIIPLLLAATVLIFGMAMALQRITAKGDNDTAANTDSELKTEESIKSIIIPKNKPDSFQAVTITPGKDFMIDDKITEESVQNEIKKIVDTASKDSFDTVNLCVNYKDGVLYGKNSEFENLLSYFTGYAHSNSMSVSITLDIGKLAKTSVANEDDVEIICGYLNSFLTNNIDMLILDGCTLSKEQSEALGGTDVAREKLSAAMKKYCVTLNNSKNTLYTGVVCNSLYTKTEGIDADFYMYDDGCADVLSWIDNKYIDFCMINNPYSTADSPSFSKVIELWNKWLADKTDTFYNIFYSKYKTGGTWNVADQLLKQIMEVDNSKAKGFMLDSYKCFYDDASESHGAVIKYLAGRITQKYIISELSVTSPSKTTYTTYDDHVAFIGASDPEFELLLNEEPVSRTEYGYFSLDLKLNEGENFFVLQHKGVQTLYTITYHKLIIKGYSPTDNKKLEGGSTLVVSCVALSNSVVTATFDGSVNKMSEEPVLNDLGEVTGEYSNYYCRITMPVSYDSNKSYGAITIKAVSSHGTESEKTGTITVFKSQKPEDSSQSEHPVSSTNPSSDGTSQGTASDTLNGPSLPSTLGGNYVNVGNGLVAEVVTYQAETFNSNDLADYSRPTNNYLPEGTVDYCSSGTISVGRETLRTLRYGKMVYTVHKGVDNIKTYSGTLPDHNEVSYDGTTVSNGHTNITFNMMWKAPFLFKIGDVKYSNEGSGSNRDYTISSATYSYIDITFCYATAVAGTNMISENDPVFSSAEWIKNSYDYTLRLHLRKTGKFYGWSAKYNSDGQLVFTFLNPAIITASSNSYGYDLTGIKVFLNVGHGGEDCGATGSNKNFTESKLNLLLANKVKAELESIGATVIMDRTGDYNLTADERMKMINDVKPDFVLAIHRNSSDKSSPKGFASYHFDPFSSEAAHKIYDATNNADLYKDSTYTGVKWHVYFVCRVTDCPVVLTENGFMSNSSEYELMVQESFNNQCARALTQGIVDYFKAIQ